MMYQLFEISRGYWRFNRIHYFDINKIEHGFQIQFRI